MFKGWVSCEVDQRGRVGASASLEVRCLPMIRLGSSSLPLSPDAIDLVESTHLLAELITGASRLGGLPASTGLSVDMVNVMIQCNVSPQRV